MFQLLEYDFSHLKSPCGYMHEHIHIGVCMWVYTHMHMRTHAHTHTQNTQLFSNSLRTHMQTLMHTTHAMHDES